MALEFLIGEIPGSADETVALVDSCVGVPLPVHTFRNVEAAESFIQWTSRTAFQDIRRLDRPELAKLWSRWWDIIGKDL